MSHTALVVRTKLEAAGLSRTMLRNGLALALAAGVAIAMATSAFANGTKTPPPACASTAPITAPCVPTVTNSGNTYMIALPGIGTFTFTVDSTGKVTVGSSPFTSTTGYTATFKIDKDTDRITVVFTNTDTTKPSVQLVIKAKPGTGSTPVVKAKVKKVHHDEDGNENQQDNDSSQHWSGGGGD